MYYTASPGPPVQRKGEKGVACCITYLHVNNILIQFSRAELSLAPCIFFKLNLFIKRALKANEQSLASSIASGQHLQRLIFYSPSNFLPEQKTTC